MSSSAFAQGGATVSGKLTNTLSGDPVAGATVRIEELQKETKSGADGAYSIEAVPPGSYHLQITADGYLPRRQDITVAAGALTFDLTVDPQLHYTEVVSVSPLPRDPFESYQPTSALAGQELTQEIEGSLGQTLESQPGVATRSFGAATARPVIRGLDGDRVLILQDSQRTGDLSSQSGDHGVNVNPAAATRIEIVRGPATLLYGANAIGGLVNVITDQIPMEPVQGASGNVLLDLGSAAREGGGAGDIHWGNGRLALHLGGGARRSGDYSTPEGDVENSQSRYGFGSVGLAWTGKQGYFGGSYGYDDQKYGIPIVEEGTIQLTPRRHSFTLRGGASGLTGGVESFRATLGYRRYRHDELEGDEVGTRFKNDSSEFEVLVNHRRVGHLKGTIGGWGLLRAFDAAGTEALSPAVDQRALAAFLYEELVWPHATFQFGTRIDRTNFEPAGETQRDFTNVSGSLGLLLRPQAANDNVTIALSLARAARNPALEELYFFGLHHGNFAIEVGDPNLQSERGLGFDASLRWRGPRVTGEVTYFRNEIGDYIFRNQISEDEFERREAEFIRRFGGREAAGHSHEAGAPAEDEDLSFVEFVAADSVLEGFEGHTDIQLATPLSLELGLDYVRGELKESGDALPRIPPFRVRGGLRYQRNAFQLGGEVTAVAKQDRVFGDEAPTDGYNLLKLFASYSFQKGNALSTITARFDNVTNELYRNHLSLIKQFAPEMGRNFRLVYNARF